MYEQELAEIQAVADTIIHQYELVFGVEYGECPNIVIEDNDAYVNRHFPEDIEDPPYLAFEKKTAYKNFQGEYVDSSHTVYMPEHSLFFDTELDKGKFIYNLAHELAHGFQKNYGALFVDDLLAKKRVSEDDPFANFKNYCNTFAQLSLLEGMADYMAITMLSQEQNKNKIIESGSTYAKKRALDYLNIETLSIEKTIQVKEFQQHIEKGYTSTEDQYSVIPRLKTFHYPAGFGYVVQQIKKGASLTEMLTHPPETIENMLPESDL